MAKLLQAVVAYGPKIGLMAAVPPQRFIELLTQRTTLSTGVFKNVQETGMETLVGLLREWCPVHTGVAIFIPSVDLEGHLNINMRVDKRMLAALNVPGIFTGSIKDSGNIGKTSQELAELWNEEYPDNPIENKEEERRI